MLENNLAQTLSELLLPEIRTSFGYPCGVQVPICVKFVKLGKIKQGEPLSPLYWMTKDCRWIEKVIAFR